MKVSDEFDRLLANPRLLGAEDGDSALVEVMRVFLGGDVKIDGEDEIGAREVQIDGQRDLRKQRERL